LKLFVFLNSYLESAVMFDQHPEPHFQSPPSTTLAGDAVISALIHIASASVKLHSPGSNRDTLDFDLVMDALRAMRPKLVELDVLQGSLHMANGRWHDALLVFRGIMNAAPSFSYAKIMYTYCLLSNGDDEWLRWLNEELGDITEPATQRLIRTLKVHADVLNAHQQQRGGVFYAPESLRELLEENAERLPENAAGASAADGPHAVDVTRCDDMTGSVFLRA